MKIAITGGAGFIGSHLTKAYLNAGHDVLVIDTLINGSCEALDPGARFYQLDIRDAKLQTVLQKERPDIVSHHAVQRQSALPLEEPSLTDADVHIRGLLNYTRQYGLAHTIFRYADVYGETASDLVQHPLSHFVGMLLAKRRPLIRGAADEIRDHIFIDDVVSANMCALERGCNQTLHISSGQGYTLKEFYATVAYLLQTEIEPVYISNSLIEPSSIVLDNTLAWQVLGWRPRVDFNTGVQLACERWYGSPVPAFAPVEVAQSESRIAAPVLVS